MKLDGVLLAESQSPVLVFETGLPTRYYIDRTNIAFDYRAPSATVTACPYQGKTTGYWSVHIGNVLHDDLAWTYDFPTPAVLGIAGLISFYNEKVDTYVDGKLLNRPITHFFSRD